MFQTNKKILICILVPVAGIRVGGENGGCKEDKAERKTAKRNRRSMQLTIFCINSCGGFYKEFGK